MLAERELRRHPGHRHRPPDDAALRQQPGSGGTRFTTDAPLVLDPTNPAVVYPVAGNVLDRSLNHGSTFTQISPSDPNDLPGCLPSESDYRSDVREHLRDDLGDRPGRSEPESRPGYANTIYVGTDTGLVWKTTDAGAKPGRSSAPAPCRRCG